MVSEWGRVSGATRMKAEIFKRGPIACAIDATSKFDKYEGGVYSEWRLFAMPNHIISVVGYGVTDDGEEYWVGRNSWGTYWGEEGFFRIKMHSDNLAIESDCVWAVPVIPDDY
jgi:cathepsin X